MNSNTPSKKCLAYLKINGWIFKGTDNFGGHLFIKNNNGLIWYNTKYNQWQVYTEQSIKIEDKLNELQQTL